MPYSSQSFRWQDPYDTADTRHPLRSFCQGVFIDSNCISKVI